MSIAREVLGIGKGEFSKKFSDIVNNHRVGSKLLGKPKDFILTACRLTDRWSKVANDPSVEVRIKSVKAGPRKVKMVVLVRTSDGREQPCGKGQIVNQLYPAKKISTSASPEKRHALKVRSAMRQSVDYQLRNFRKSVRFPAECVHTGRQIRKGMRWDVDHIGKPFVQLCDEWIELHEMTYLDVSIVGPPNLKRFKDSKLQNHWVLFHEMNATFAPSLPKANRSQGSGEYQASEALLGSLKKEDPDDVDLDF